VRLQDGRAIVADADSGGNRDARIIFTPSRAGMYRVVATSCVPATGRFSLTVQEIVQGKGAEAARKAAAQEAKK